MCCSSSRAICARGRAPLAAGDEATFPLTFSDDSTYELTAPIKDYSGANETYEGGDMDMDMSPTPTPSN